MADVSITAANVRKGTGAAVETRYAAGESVTAGQAVYQKSTDGKWWRAQCDGTAEESGSGVLTGVALHASGADQPLAVQTGGEITIGGTVIAGTEYVVSATAGGIAPHADLVSTNKYTRLGYATTSAILQLDISATGIVIP